MSKRNADLVKHVAELVTQNKSMQAENKRLTSQNEKITQELEKYKLLLEKSKQERDGSTDHRKTSKTLRFKTATIMYADALGFSDIKDDMDTKILVDNLDEIFINLETIIDKYDIKKLKSFGDSIMCAGGIPEKNITNPIEVVQAAIEMQYYLKDLQRTYQNDKIWKLKIGIHTGPVLAEINGRKKQHYDVKGDTVNLATRIRSFCEEGSILISENTYELIKDLFICEYYGKLPVKYKGDMQMYVVKGIKKEFSLQQKGLIPNKAFSTKYSLVRFTDMQERILDILEKELPNNLYYHNVKHTVDVVTQVELIGWGEGLNDEEILLLKTAALFHDIGHIRNYDEHEYNGTQIAKDILPDYYYTQAQIDKICNLIMATKMPPNPGNKLEEIMCDADLDYLGRSDMIPVSNMLFHELKERNKIDSLNEWNKLQMRFISNHQYFTNTARTLREVNKQKQIERIKNLIED